VREARIVRQNVGLHLPGREQVQDELDRQRVPRITGLPARISGSTTMRSGQDVPS
jgi:hypothetical protein